jgi:hypothetical protein
MILLIVVVVVLLLIFAGLATYLKRAAP